MDKTQIMIDAIQSFFGDNSQTREETINGLERAKSHIDLLLETLSDDEDDTSPTQEEETGTGKQS
ncbi:MAG: hypothetical protein PHX60_06725 [Giesbergeria sp.]|uniref:hypothetical protein n=1 Tax=Giesbergeria sp. TaxID=2818473 RepID=UPI00261C7104|nr:hypothetical protein [Giesbergeria sp.]MDD2609378.1 hypothetical protein [Giesbergeria sp.]